MTTAHTHLANGLDIDAALVPPDAYLPSWPRLRVLGLTYDAMTLWILGYPERALERLHQALHLAEEVAQP